MVFQTDDTARLRRQQTDQAIKAAMQSRWEEAVELNRSIIELTKGSDSDAYNRLGRSLMALGRYGESREAYSNALRLDPTNQIARKNLAALENKLGDDGQAPAAPREHVDPRLFVEETGKTGVLLLQHPQRALLARMAPGERVYLRREANTLLAANAGGETLGQVEPRLAMRLIRMIDGGNQYDAAISQITADAARIIIKETYQSPGLAGRLSFPPAGVEGMPRAYTRDSVRRYDEDDEDEVAEENDNADTWDGDTDQRDTSDVRLIDFPKVAERADRDDLGFDDE